MIASVRAASIALAGTFAAPLLAQASDDAELLARFEQLSFRQKAAIVRAIARRLATLDDPLVRRVAALRLEVDELPDAPELPPIHDAEIYRSTSSPPRTIVRPGTKQHEAVRARYPNIRFLDDLRPEVEYDWTTGRIVRRPEPLGYADLFANALHGYPPGTDCAVARILETLDHAAPQRSRRGDHAVPLRELSQWFGHAYCDLGANAYVGVTLYEVWYSGRIVDVPDVDAIAFAWEVLGDRSVKGPLSGAPRTALYETIRRHALILRKHRTLCEAAAAAYVRAEPILDPLYAMLVPRFHYLFAANDDRLEAIANVFARKDRGEILEGVDDKIREASGTAFEIREGRKRELEESAARVRALAVAALERFGG